MAIIVAHIIIQIQHPNLKGRYQHIATAISLGKGLTEVTVFGGFQDLRIQLRIVSNTAVLRFGELIFFHYTVTGGLEATVGQFTPF